MQKQFAGQKVREARARSGLNLSAFAARLGVSVSYLSQIENNQRSLSGKVLVRLLDVFDLDPKIFEPGGEHRLLADLREACATPAPNAERVPLAELRQVAASAPRFAQEYLALQRVYRQADERLKMIDEAMRRDGAGEAALLPYEEVRDYFHYRDNYVHELDVAAEALGLSIGAGAGAETRLEARLLDEHGVAVERRAAPDLVRRYEPQRKTLVLNAAQPPETRAFQIAYHLVSIELRGAIEETLARAGLGSRSAADICRVALANYAAGALLMPYAAFCAAARAERYDVEVLALRFGASIEQVCHRLSNLQRPGMRGVPIYFLRMDPAGNITKRHSATRLHFARYGGTCPLWNVHEAFSAPDRFIVQVAEMPDGVRYLSVARAILKPSGSFSAASRRYVLGFGCELQHAPALIYSEAADLQQRATPIGASCRICERAACGQRAFPPLDRRILVSEFDRAVVPFSILADGE